MALLDRSNVRDVGDSPGRMLRRMSLALAMTAANGITCAGDGREWELAQILPGDQLAAG
jgi:hypothetical protein